MGDLKISSMEAGSSSNTITNYSVDAQDLDSPTDQNETIWVNQKFTQWLGYFKEIPELNSAINAKATWTIGKGFEADPETTFLLDSIRGFGKDTFNTILENMIRTYYIGGDAFCEIIRDDKGKLINLKPLNPATVQIVVGKDGIMKRYEQINTTKKGKNTKFKVEDIFHLARNRIGDEVHGNSVIESVENIILARNEAISDYKDVMHDNVRPRWKFKLKTDDPTEIAAYKAKMDAVTATKSQNVYEPFDVSESELISVAPNATLDPKAWIDQQGDFFYEAVGTPQIIMGGSGEFTEASSKIAYLAYQQNIEEEQLFIEEQTGLQLGLEIDLEFPASLENELLSDNKKDGDMTESKPSETTAGMGQ
ncbi:MAG: phage portal protein [bacterium]|nr:phage portal protein [bacterium]